MKWIYIFITKDNITTKQLRATANKVMDYENKKTNQKAKMYLSLIKTCSMQPIVNTAPQFSEHIVLPV